MRYFIILFCLTFLFFSCKEKNNLELSYSEPKIVESNFSQNLKIHKAVFFDFPDSLFFGIVKGVEFKEDKIIIHQDGINSSLLFFDQKGNFEKLFMKMGSGPGEYSTIDFFLISSSTIYIYDRSKMALILYDYDTFQFRKELPLEFYLVSGFSLNSEEDLILVSDSFFSEEKHNGFVFANFLEEDIKIIPQFASVIEAFAYSNFSTIGNDVFISLPLSERIVRLAGKDLVDFRQIDFGPKSLPNQIFKIEDAYDFYDLLESSSYYFAIHNFTEYQSILSFNFYDENIENIRVGLIDLESKLHYILRTKDEFEANFIRAVNVRDGKLNSFLLPGEYTSEDLSNLNLGKDFSNINSLIMVQYNFELSK